MSNKPLSARAEKALKLLESGAQFRDRLETNSYTGRAKFQTRLVQNGTVIAGYGFSTFEELSNMLCICNSTTVSTYYALPYVKKPEPASMDW